jgi:hypothetical protein
MIGFVIVQRPAVLLAALGTLILGALLHHGLRAADSGRHAG